MKRLGFLLLVLTALFATSPAKASSVLYSNGAINGTITGWTINYNGYYVSDSFTVSSASVMTGFDFGDWSNGAAGTAVDWSVNTSPFSGSVGGGTTNLSNVFLFANGGGYNIYDSTSSSAISLALAPGTYWLELGNGQPSGYGTMFWDENDGPSAAQENTIGGIGSESFNVYGSSVPEPGTLVMLGTGLLGLAGFAKRKFLS